MREHHDTPRWRICSLLLDAQVQEGNTAGIWQEPIGMTSHSLSGWWLAPRLPFSHNATEIEQSNWTIPSNFWMDLILQIIGVLVTLTIVFHPLAGAYKHNANLLVSCPREPCSSLRQSSEHPCPVQQCSYPPRGPSCRPSQRAGGLAD